MVPDFYSTSEQSWNLINVCTMEIVMNGTYNGAVACLDANQRYDFSMFDSYGDGFGHHQYCYSDDGDCGYKLYYDDELIHESGNFTFEEITMFGGLKDLKGKFEFVSGKMRTCAWAGRQKLKRCGFEVVAEHCPETCDMSLCPSDDCKDTDLKFWFNNTVKKCDWASRGNTEWKCHAYDAIVSESCPVTCKACNGVCKDTGGKFELPDGSGREKGCWWVRSRDEDKKNELCAYTLIAERCPWTCDSCV